MAVLVRLLGELNRTACVESQQTSRLLISADQNTQIWPHAAHDMGWELWRLRGMCAGLVTVAAELVEFSLSAGVACEAEQRPCDAPVDASADSAFNAEAVARG